MIHHTSPPLSIHFSEYVVTGCCDFADKDKAEGDRLISAVKSELACIQAMRAPTSIVCAYRLRLQVAAFWEQLY